MGSFIKTYDSKSYSSTQWERFTRKGRRSSKIRFLSPSFPFLNTVILDLNQEQLDPRERIELKVGNDVLTDSDLSIVRELLQEALYDLTVVEETITLVHVIRRGLLTQARRDHDITVVLQQDQSTPDGLLILLHARTERVRRLRAALAPHKKLPPEILAKIFRDACNDQAYDLLPRSPRHTIPQVCTRWRQVVLNEPSIWDTIAIRSDHDPGPNFATRMGEIFARSANRPISLTVDGSRYLGNPLVRTPITDIVLPHLSRFRVLSLKFPSICFSPLFESPPALLKSLERLKLNLKWGSDEWQSFDPFVVAKPVTVFSGALNLQQVEIESQFNHGPWFRFDPTAFCLPWAQLTRLFLGPAVAVTPAHAHEVLRQSTKLVNCRLDITSAWIPIHSIAIPPFICPDLEILLLFIINDANMTQFLRPLILPSLKDIKITTESYSFEQGELISLIRRSRCSIMSIALKSHGQEMVDEAFLEELPSARKFETHSLTFTHSVFDKISCRQLLPKMGVFCARTDSPGSFVDMLESRNTTGDENSHPRLHIARVACHASVPRSSYDTALQRLRRLKCLEGQWFSLWRVDDFEAI